MNNKPVAWMSNGKEFYVQKNYCPDFIPLYTHPVKELTLTSEQVRKIAIECDAYENEDTGGLITDDICIGSFARAILRKASEK